MNAFESTPPDFLVAQKTVYEPNGFICKHFVSEAESKEYGACEFEMNHKRIKFRIGKITPTKIGQFVTLWKRIGTGTIQPFDMADPVDLFVVSVRSDDKLGQFVFPKTVLCEKGIVSKEGKGGKHAIRIYPLWDIAENRQAKKTQAWQLMYFFEIYPDGQFDRDKVTKLFS